MYNNRLQLFLQYLVVIVVEYIITKNHVLISEQLSDVAIHCRRE